MSVFASPFPVNFRSKNRYAKIALPHALRCSVLGVQCPMSNVQCPMPNALRPTETPTHRSTVLLQLRPPVSGLSFQLSAFSVSAFSLHDFHSCTVSMYSSFGMSLIGLTNFVPSVSRRISRRSNWDNLYNCTVDNVLSWR